MAFNEDDDDDDDDDDDALIPMTDATETGAINRLHLPAPVSGTCVISIWDWIRLVPDSGAD